MPRVGWATVLVRCPMHIARAAAFRRDRIAAERGNMDTDRDSARLGASAVH
jgi:hypothetical protein